MYEDHPNPDVVALDKAFCTFCRGLLQQQIDFDVVDEESLAAATIESGQVLVGKRRYDVIALPPMDTIHLRTMEVLAGFVDTGGAVFAHPMSPKYAAEGEEKDPKIVALAERAKAAGGLGGSQPGSPPIGYLIKSRLCDDCGLHPASPAMLLSTIRREEGTAYFLVNTSGIPYEGTCTLRGAGRPVIYDPSTNKEQPVPILNMSGSSCQIALNLCPYESMFVLFERQ